jgi:hypothetical protein
VLLYPLTQACIKLAGARATRRRFNLKTGVTHRGFKPYWLWASEPTDSLAGMHDRTHSKAGEINSINKEKVVLYLLRLRGNQALPRFTLAKVLY